MKQLLLSLVLISATVSAPAFDGDPIDGKWKVLQNGAGEESAQICTLVQVNESLTGSCTSATAKVDISGTVEGIDISWTYRSEINGSPLTVTYHGVVETPVKITGTIHAEEIEIENYFTADKIE